MAENDKHVLHGQIRKEYPTFLRGEGVFVYDQRGLKILDAISGVGVVNIGHGVEEVVDAIAAQSRTMAYSYGGVADNEPRKQLASKIQHWAPDAMGETKTMFCSGGAEANEGALKIAYQYHYERGKPTKRKVIGRWQSYHGNTIGALSMSGRTSWRRMHSPYLLNFPHIQPPHCYRCPWERTVNDCGLPCAYELRRVIRQEGPENIAAFIAEPIIGTSLSAVVPPQDYYRIVRQICDDHDVLFIVDEVMSGVGRIGYPWGIDYWDVAPDIITAAKGLTGGYAPIGATILSEKVWKGIADHSGTVMHSYTYGGNPVSCAAGVATLNYIEKHNLVAKAGEQGAKLLARLRTEFADHPHVGDIRGIGLFVGLELVEDRTTKSTFPRKWNLAERIEEHAIENGLLVLGGVPGTIDGVFGDHLELIPPYIIEDEHLDLIATRLHQSIDEVISQLSA